MGCCGIAGWARPRRWSSSLGAASADSARAGELNGVVRYDLGNILNTFFGDDIDSNPYFSHEHESLFFDTENFPSFLNNNHLSNVHLSLNVQSLNCKFDGIKNLLLNLKQKNINVNILAMQEIWQLPHPDLYNIDGFSLYTQQRVLN